jgi:hypothetical protein
VPENRWWCRAIGNGDLRRISVLHNMIHAGTTRFGHDRDDTSHSAAERTDFQRTGRRRMRVSD